METTETPVEETEAKVPSGITEQSETQEIGDVAADSPEEPKVSRRDRRAERRIARLTARNAELAEKLESEQKRFDQIEARLDSMTQPKARPQRDDFESDEDYEDALVDHRLEMKQSKPTQPEDPRPGAVDQALVDRFQGFIDETDKTVPGFADMVTKAHFPLTDHALNDIIEMGEDGADVFTNLNTNPTEAMRISRLSPREQTIELEKIADSLDVKSSAPDPITPVTGNDQPTVDENKLSDEAWIRRRNKKVFGF